MLTALARVLPTHEEALFKLVFGKKVDVIEREHLDESGGKLKKSWKSMTLSENFL